MSTMVIFNPRSSNKKLGPIPTATIEKSTCPTSCPLKDNGCYANSGMSRYTWDEVGRRGVPWSVFLDCVSALPAGTLWRYAVAGDLPGHENAIDADQFHQLGVANSGRRGFTFTHKPLTAENEELIAWANFKKGFAINISAWDKADADKKADRGVGPVVCLIPWGTAKVSLTPSGRTVLACPAQWTRGEITCKTCQKCADPNREEIIGFYPHGSGRANGGKDVNARLVKGEPYVRSKEDPRANVEDRRE